MKTAEEKIMEIFFGKKESSLSVNERLYRLRALGIFYWFYFNIVIFCVVLMVRYGWFL